MAFNTGSSFGGFGAGNQQQGTGFGSGTGFGGTSSGTGRLSIPFFATFSFFHPLPFLCDALFWIRNLSCGETLAPTSPGLGSLSRLSTVSTTRNPPRTPMERHGKGRGNREKEQQQSDVRLTRFHQSSRLRGNIVSLRRHRKYRQCVWKHFWRLRLRRRYVATSLLDTRSRF